MRTKTDYFPDPIDFMDSKELRLANDISDQVIIETSCDLECDDLILDQELLLELRLAGL